MSRKQSISLLMLIIIVASSVTGCNSKPQSTFDIHTIASYRDIPDITEDEIAGIEALKASRQSFSFGKQLSAEGFELPDGTYAGFTPMFCELLSTLFEIPFVLDFYEWDSLISGIDSKRIDFSSEFAVPPNRPYIMSNPIVQRSLGVLTYGDRKFETPNDLKGLKVGIFSQDSSVASSIASAYPEVKFETIPIRSRTADADMLRSGEIDAIIDTSMRLTFDYEDTDFTILHDLLPLAYIPVTLTTANPELEPMISVMNKYIAAGGFNKLYELNRAGDVEYKRYMLFNSFTDEERAYIDSLSTEIPVVMGTDIYPISFYNKKDGGFQGISMDVLDEISEITGIKFKVANEKGASWTTMLEMLRTGEAALICELMITEERREHFIWPDTPYYSSPYAFLSKADYPYLELYQIEQARVGLVESCATNGLYNQWFPNYTNYKIYSTQDEVLDALEKNEVDLFFTLGYIILYQQNYREKPNFKTNYAYPVSNYSFFGLNKNEKILCSIIDRSISYIDTDKISNDWTSRSFDYSKKLSEERARIFAIFAACLTVLLVLLIILFLQNLHKRKADAARNILLNAAIEQAEQARQETKKTLDNTSRVLNSADIMIFTSDLETDEILFITDRWIENHGLEGDLIGMPCYKAFHGNEERCAHCPRHSLDAAPDAEVIWEDFSPKTNKIFRKTDRYIDWTDGRKVHIQLATDITDIKQMEIEVAEANERIKLMLDSTPLCCQFWDSDYNKIDCNEEAVRLFGFTDKQDYLERHSELNPEYQPDGQRSDEKAAKHVKQAFEEGYCTFDWTYKMLDGSTMPAEVVLVRVKHKDHYVVIGYTRDMREHNKMMNDIEHRDDLLHATNMAAVLLLNAGIESFDSNLFQSMNLLAEAIQVDRMYIWKNTMVDGELHCSQIGNWTKEDCPRYFDELEEDMVYSKVIPRWEDLLSKGETINSLVRDMPPEEQALMSIQDILCITAIPIFVEENFWGFISFADCHEERIFTSEEISIMRSAGLLIANTLLRNEMILHLRKISKKANMANKAKSDFLSNMSHEMRTPMNAIIGMTTIGKKSEDIEQKNHALNKIGDASSHLLGVINDVLDMAKIEANKLELAPAEYHFERMLQKTLTVVNFRVEEKQQQLTLNVDSRIPRFLFGDDQRLAQVITNLLSNAVKFTPENGKISIDVSLVNETDGNCELRFEVADSGIGISPEQQERLFLAFEQAKSGISREYGGTGLGLAISKNIIELMGGSIWIESELGKGARFIFTIKSLRSDKSPRSLLSSEVNWNNVRIMAVDDIAETRDQIREIFAQLGISCDVAVDGLDACRIIEEHGPYDIYFIDWFMPGMDGIELTRKIKSYQTSKPCVVIMITAMDWEQIRDEAIQAGVNKCLLKPLLSSMMIDCINECLGIADNNNDNNVFGSDEFVDKKLLIAEDIEINREILIALLEDTGIQIDCAVNGKEALEMIEAAPEKYDIVFMDVQMPQMDGIEATRLIRALPERRRGRLPIIAMTANVFKSDIEECLAAGMDDHLGKPLDIDKVLEKLHNYLK